MTSPGITEFKDVVETMITSLSLFAEELERGGYRGRLWEKLVSEGGVFAPVEQKVAAYVDALLISSNSFNETVIINMEEAENRVINALLKKIEEKDQEAIDVVRAIIQHQSKADAVNQRKKDLEAAIAKFSPRIATPVTSSSASTTTASTSIRGVSSASNPIEEVVHIAVAAIKGVNLLAKELESGRFTPELREQLVSEGGVFVQVEQKVVAYVNLLLQSSRSFSGTVMSNMEKAEKRLIDALLKRIKEQDAEVIEVVREIILHQSKANAVRKRDQELQASIARFSPGKVAEEFVRIANPRFNIIKKENVKTFLQRGGKIRILHPGDSTTLKWFRQYVVSCTDGFYCSQVLYRYLADQGLFLTMKPIAGGDSGMNPSADVMSLMETTEKDEAPFRAATGGSRVLQLGHAEWGYNVIFDQGLPLTGEVSKMNLLADVMPLARITEKGEEPYGAATYVSTAPQHGHAEWDGDVISKKSLKSVKEFYQNKVNELVDGSSNIPSTIICFPFAAESFLIRLLQCNKRLDNIEIIFCNVENEIIGPTQTNIESQSEEAYRAFYAKMKSMFKIEPSMFNSGNS